MGRSIKRVALISLLFGAVIGASILTTHLAPDEPPQSDPEPTEIFTPVPRTPRAQPTATGTRAATPTIGAGLYLFDTGDPNWTGSCAEAVATAIATVPMATRVTVEDGVDSYSVAVCNMTGIPLNLQLRQETYEQGYSIAYTMNRGCYPTWPFCVDYPMRAPSTWTTGPMYQCDISGAPICPIRSSTHIGSWLAGPVTGGYNEYEFGSAFGAEMSCCDSPPIDPLAWGEYELEYAWDANPPSDAGPTPTPAATCDPQFTEVQARPQGAVCGDWNLRGGCGNDDQFAEVMTCQSMSLAGYRIEVYEGTPPP